MNIELVYLPFEKTALQFKLSLPIGSTIQDALNISNLLKTHPEVQTLSLGIFSKHASLDTRLKSGDRIEIYRNLTTSPKEKRRQRIKEHSQLKQQI